MFTFEKKEELTCLCRGSGEIFAKKGAMIAYKGDFTFDKKILGANNGNGLVGALFDFGKRAITGETMSIMSAKGSGELYLAQNAYHVQIFDLDPGEDLSVESENILAFPVELYNTPKFLGVGVISQKGLFTSYFKNTTNEVVQVAVITDGNPIYLEGPCYVDPDALVAFTGKDPSFAVNKLSWKNLIGQHSGESYTLRFDQPGQVVLVQPSERLSGLRVSID